MKWNAMTSMVVAAILLVVLGAMPPDVAAKKPSSNLTVDCSSGGKVQDVIDRTAPWVPLQIAVVGVCREAVYIARDDVTLLGASPGASIAASSGSGVYVAGGRRIAISGLTLSGPEAALAADAAFVTLNDVTLEGSEYNGIDAVLGSDILLENSRVRNNQGGGVLLENGSTLGIFNSSVSDNGRSGISLNKNSTANIHNTELSGNGGAGLSIGDNSTAHVKEATLISGNTSHGISLVLHSDVRVFSDPEISGNGGSGLFLARDSGAELVGSVTISGNADVAVRCVGDESRIDIQDYTNIGQAVVCGGF